MSLMSVTLLSTSRRSYVNIVTYLTCCQYTQQLYSVVSGCIFSPFQIVIKIFKTHFMSTLCPLSVHFMSTVCPLYVHFMSTFTHLRSLRSSPECDGLDYARTNQEDRPRSRRSLTPGDSLPPRPHSHRGLRGVRLKFHCLPIF